MSSQVAKDVEGANKNHRMSRETTEGVGGAAVPG